MRALGVFLSTLLFLVLLFLPSCFSSCPLAVAPDAPHVPPTANDRIYPRQLDHARRPGWLEGCPKCKWQRASARVRSATGPEAVSFFYCYLLVSDRVQVIGLEGFGIAGASPRPYRVILTDFGPIWSGTSAERRAGKLSLTVPESRIKFFSSVPSLLKALFQMCLQQAWF